MITMRRQSLTLPASGSYTWPATGDFVFIEAASVDCELRCVNVGDGGATIGDAMLVRRAVSHRFRRLYDQLTITGAAGAAVTIWTGEGESNLNLISGSVTVASGGTFDSSANQSIGATSSLDLAADSTRFELHLQVPPTNAADLAVRDQSATTDEGILLGPNGLSFYQLSCAGAVRIRNNTAGALTLRYAEVKS